MCYSLIGLFSPHCNVSGHEIKLAIPREAAEKMTQLTVSVLIWNSGAPTKMRSCIACGDNAVCFEKDAFHVVLKLVSIYSVMLRRPFSPSLEEN